MTRTLPLRLALSMGATLLAVPVLAADLHADMKRATAAGPGESIGSVTVSESASGAAFAVAVTGLPPGQHGFHVHENGSCDASTTAGQPTPAGAAGSHLDPAHTGHHQGPEKEGHLGDLPALTVAADGSAHLTLTASRIKDLQAIRGRALMIHAGGDNYADEPPLGGGGARIACGILQ